MNWFLGKLFPLNIFIWRDPFAKFVNCIFCYLRFSSSKSSPPHHIIWLSPTYHQQNSQWNDDHHCIDVLLAVLLHLHLRGSSVIAPPQYIDSADLLTSSFLAPTGVLYIGMRHYMFAGPTTTFSFFHFTEYIPPLI